MNIEQRELVSRSWHSCDKIAVVTELYSALFDQHPALENLFLGDNKALIRKFMDTVDLIVNHLAGDDAEALSLPFQLQLLGQQHIAYGVQPRHYQLVEEALLTALATELGDNFDANTKLAWQFAYRDVAAIMLAGRATSL